MSMSDREMAPGELDHTATQRLPSRHPGQSLSSPTKEHRVTNIGGRILSELSPKELCVANLLLVEGTNRAIACKMGTSIETAKTHLVHMFHKVGVEDRLSLAIALIRHGVVACPCAASSERQEAVQSAKGPSK